jgi:peptidyl-prolyl cis-trans isomerase C
LGAVRQAGCRVLPQLVTTRYGFHVVEVLRRIPGRPIPFAHAQARIAEHLTRRAEERALAQYVQVLAGRARVEGVAFDVAASPLVQ